MKNLPALAKTAACILVLASIFFTASCAKKTAAPEPFTAQLEDIEGAMFFYSLQHPKRISRGIDKLIAEVPEAAVARILLETSAAKFGYPEFTEIETGSNIGLFMPADPANPLRHEKRNLVIFIKLKKGGKIWNALVEQGGMIAKKHGGWTLLAQTEEALGAVPNPDAVIAKLSAPQTEHLRTWMRLDGEVAGHVKTNINEAIAKVIKQSKLPGAEKTAFTDYASILVDELFDSLHSGHGSVHLGDKGVRLSYGAQFKPDTAFGAFLRYRTDAEPAVAQYIASDALVSGAFRYAPKAAKDLADHITNQILKVDYPPFAKPLADLNATYADRWNKAGGNGALAMDIDMDIENPLSPKIEVGQFVVESGKFDQQSMRQISAGMELAQNIMNHCLAIATQSGARNMAGLDITTGETNTIEGVEFSSMTIHMSVPDVPRQTQTTYYGIADGNLVTATSEEVITKRLPALLAKKPLAGNIAEAVTLQPYELMGMTLNGAALVDLISNASKIDLSDDDRKAMFEGVKDRYNRSAPLRIAIEARQADVSYKIEVPYQFIAASVKLGQYVYVLNRQNKK